MLLNDLNNLKINGNRITQELKLFLLHGLCEQEASLTKANIKKYLLMHGKITKQDTVGKENENDTAFHSSLSSLLKLRTILGEPLDRKMCENIILWHTVFGEEKKTAVAKIRNAYGHILTEEQVIKLGKLSFKGWGRLSAKFLEGIATTDTKTGETALTIRRLMEDTTMNLMEILNSERFYPKFVDSISEENRKEEKVGFSYDSLVKDLYCSPIVKRSIWQALLICKELTKINGCPPEKIFIEVTRGEDKNKRGKASKSRKEQLEALLQKCVKDKEELRALLTALNGKTEQELRSDRLFLYFSQFGKCMYTERPIDLSQLNKESLYDIDHIYPQSLIKDDSLTNRVLVCRDSNANKGAAYPLSDSIRRSRQPFWELLLSKGLIHKEKYARLICAQPLTVGASKIDKWMVENSPNLHDTQTTCKCTGRVENHLKLHKF
jgi:CRISPR-associated endonuclease Csn1